MAMAFLEGVKKICTQAVDVLFPPRCFSCGELVDEQHNICSACWGELSFIADPYCQQCGDPFAYSMKDASHCMTCLQAPPPFATARAVLRYSPTSRRLIAGYKYYDRTQATPMFASWLARVGGEALRNADAVIPVPLHKKRLLSRRYNQSALLAQALGNVSGRQVWVDGMRRTRHTPQQAGLTRTERQENVKAAFAINPAYADQLPGASIALVDDVITTGATLHACSHALLEAGVKEVHILTLARRVLED